MILKIQLILMSFVSLAVVAKEYKIVDTNMKSINNNNANLGFIVSEKT
jgi:hypothetical protein